jgi:hypothetical protein
MLLSAHCQADGPAPAGTAQATPPATSSVPEKSFAEKLRETLNDPNYPFRWAAYADGVRTRDKCGREVQAFVASPWVISSGDPRDAQSGICPSCSYAVVPQTSRSLYPSSQVVVAQKKKQECRPILTYSFVQQSSPCA